MSDQPVHATPIPALPSRAAQAPTPHPEPMFEDAPKKPRSRVGVGAKAAVTREKNERLKFAEIKKLKAKRAKALKNKKAKRKPRNDKHAIEPAAAAGKNPNRPLEMKNQLAAVLEYSTQMTRPELTLFATTMKAMQELPRGSRRRVIAALAQVYP